MQRRLYLSNPLLGSAMLPELPGGFNFNAECGCKR